MASVGLQTFLPVGAQRRLRRAAGARDVGGDGLPAGQHRGHRRGRLFRDAHGAPRPHRRDGAAGRRGLLALVARRGCRCAAMLPLFVVDRLRAGLHRPVARPDRAQRDAQGRVGPRLRLRLLGARPGRDARARAGSASCSTTACRARCSSSSACCSSSRSARCCRCAGRHAVANLARSTHGSRNRRPARTGLRGQQGTGPRLRGSAGARGRRRDDRRAHRSRRARARRRRSARSRPQRGVGRVRHHHGGGPRGGAGRVSAAGHPGQQRRRAAAGRFPRLGSRRVDPRASTPTC